MKNSKTIKLGEVIKLITKGTTPNKKMGGFCLSGINYIKSESIKYDGKIDKDKFSFISKYTHGVLKRSQLEENDILFSMAGAYLGKSAIVTKDLLPANTNQALAIIRIDKLKANPKFINYFFKDKKTIDYVNNISGQSAQPNINFEEIKSIDIPFFSLRDQEKIVSLLSSLDDKIDLLHRQNKMLESMAETLFRQWFIAEAQEDWQTTTLDCHITVAKGLSYKGAGLTTSDNGIPLFSLNSVLEGGGYKSAGLKYYDGVFKERHTIKPGDIIVANTEQGHEYRLIGYPAIIPKTDSEVSIYTHHLFKISINEESYLTNPFIYYLLCSKDMHEQVVAATNGSTVNQLSADGLQRPEFKLPPEFIVKDFTLQINLLWKKININNSQIKSIESIRDTLLPKLMSGEVQVQYVEEKIE